MSRIDMIFEILARIRPESNFRESSNYMIDGLLDSFDIITLVADLESSFGISIPGTAITPENFHTADTILKLIEQCPKHP